MTKVLTPKPRIPFDVRNKDHRRIYAEFLKTGKWNDGFGFLLKEPHEIVPVMIERELAVFALQKDNLITQEDLKSGLKM